MPSGIIFPPGRGKLPAIYFPPHYGVRYPSSMLWERGWGEGSLLHYLQGNLNPPGHLHNLEENLKFVIDQILP
jgi:hypothetical protein